MRVTVLSGNSASKPNPLNFKSENGLSLLIEFDERKILFDTGKSDLFIHNAEAMGIDLSDVDYLIISNGHSSDSGGLKHFLKINKITRIFLHICEASEFYTEIAGYNSCYHRQDQESISQCSRIYFIGEDTQIEEKIILLNGFPEVFPQTGENETSFEKTGSRFVIDDVKHEIGMLLIENNEIVMFSGCLHSGIINIIEEVKLFSKAMRIKAAFGGFHFHNSISKNILAINAGQVFEV